MTKPPSPRPLGIKLIVFLYYFTTATCLASLGNDFLFNLFEGLMFLVLGFGLWHLGELSRRVTIGFELFNIAHTIFAWLECLNPSQASIEFFRQSLSIKSSADLAPMLKIYLVLLTSLIFMKCLIIWFLIKRKSAFVKPTAPTQTSV